MLLTPPYNLKGTSSISQRTSYAQPLHLPPPPPFSPHHSSSFSYFHSRALSDAAAREQHVRYYSNPKPVSFPLAPQFFDALFLILQLADRLRSDRAHYDDSIHVMIPLPLIYNRISALYWRSNSRMRFTSLKQNMRITLPRVRNELCQRLYATICNNMSFSALFLSNTALFTLLCLQCSFVTCFELPFHSSAGAKEQAALKKRLDAALLVPKADAALRWCSEPFL